MRKVIYPQQPDLVIKAPGMTVITRPPLLQAPPPYSLPACPPPEPSIPLTVAAWLSVAVRSISVNYFFL